MNKVYSLVNIINTVFNAKMVIWMLLTIVKLNLPKIYKSVEIFDFILLREFILI